MLPRYIGYTGCLVTEGECKEREGGCFHVISGTRGAGCRRKIIYL